MKTTYHGNALGAVRHDYTRVAAASPTHFDQVVAEAREQRATFERLFREACLALGKYCSAVDEAIGLANAAARQTSFGMYPEHSNAIRELSTPPRDLLANLEPATS